MTTEFAVGATTALVPAIAVALLHFLWQGTAIGIGAWLILHALRGAHAQTRYVIACIALLACFWLPLQTMLHAMQTAGTAPALLTSAPHADARTSPESLFALRMAWRSQTPALDAALPWVVALWSLGVGAMLLRLLAGLSWLHRVRRHAQIAVPESWRARIDALATHMGLGRRVRLLLCEDDEGPFSAGILRPVVIVPAALLARMPAELIEALLAHELAHIRRHDYLVNLLQTLVESLLFYHPAVWWLSRRIRIERELIADDIAAHAIGDPRRLALALSRLDLLKAERHSPMSASPAQAAQGGQLMTRIRRLLRPSRPDFGARAALPAIIVIALGVACYAYASTGTSSARQARPTAATAAVMQATAAPQTVQVADTTRHGATGDDDVSRITIGNDHDSYALVIAGDDGITFSGDTDDLKDVRAMRRRIDVDFLWFRRHGKAYVIRDQAVLARIAQRWSTTSATQREMQTLNQKMQSRNQELQALNAQMGALNVARTPSKQMQDATAEISRLASEQGRLAAQSARLAIARGNAEPSAEEQQIEHRTEALDREIERLNATIEREASALETQSAPMEALAAKIEAASAPMEALGDEMEALSARIERDTKAADRDVRNEIDRAFRNGQAEPAPSRW